MVRNRVDLPEPDLPSSATTSPSFRVRLMSSRTGRTAPSVPAKFFVTPLHGDDRGAWGGSGDVADGDWGDRSGNLLLVVGVRVSSVFERADRAVARTAD